MKECDSARVTTLVDNDVWRNGTTSSWGLSFHVEIIKGKERRILLMDTDVSFDVLFNNASKLNIDLSDIEAIFISHWHGDHCGSLSHVLSLSRRPTPVYVPSENPSGIKKMREAGGIPRVCSEPVEFIEAVMSTGEFSGWVSEHSLVINVKKRGLVILTGCAHPGVVNIVKRAQQVSGVSKMYAVIGGFHISVDEAIKTANLLREIRVELVSPCHCTNDNVKKAISETLETRYVNNGSGKVFSIN